MLVLSRKTRESVVIGDEVKVTVEEISGGDEGRRILGATVRLGFQSPRYVAIQRSELLARGSGGGHGRGAAKRSPPPSGKLVEINDARVRLRIQTPRKIPVCCNGAPADAVVSQEAHDRSDAPSDVHCITCRKEDRITICHNITIAALDIRRFIPS